VFGTRKAEMLKSTDEKTVEASSLESKTFRLEDGMALREPVVDTDGMPVKEAFVATDALAVRGVVLVTGAMAVGETLEVTDALVVRETALVKDTMGVRETLLVTDTLVVRDPLVDCGTFLLKEGEKFGEPIGKKKKKKTNGFYVSYIDHSREAKRSCS